LSAAAPDYRDRLAELEVEHATLLAELRAFEADYLRQVGVIDVQVQEAEAKILTIVWERSGADVDQRAAEAAAKRFHETTTAMQAVPPPPGPPPTDDLKTLFRDAAKRMHPDLVSDPAGREHAEAFMKRLNDAYRDGDSEAIGNLVRQWETSPYAVAVAERGPAPALAAAVAQAQQRVDEIRETDLAKLMEQAFMASMHGRDLLAELRAQAEMALATAKAKLAELDA
jgi:hypothetical protein